MGGVTLRGAVRLKTGVTEFGFSRDDEGNGVISWESVPAGMWSYDVFMDDGSEESPLLYGCFVSSGRVTPDLPGEQQAVAGAVVVQLPEGSGCVQVVLDNASSAAWYAEQAKKYAENFSLSVDEVTTGEPGTPAAAEAVKGEAAGSYKLSFTIPRGDVGPEGPAGPQGETGDPGPKGDPGDVNTEESYTWSQPQAFSSAINANGGVNIPLAVGAPTNESGVNRLYAAGLAAVTDAFSVRCYPLLADCSSSNGTVFKTDREPNSLYFNVPPNSAFTVKCGLVTNARPMHNYSSIRGWVAPLRLPAVSTKFTARFGQMTTVARMGRDRDAFTLVPDQAAGGYKIGEIIDITFDHVRDADAGGYHIRVREIYYSNAEQKWKMKTTQALAPETSSNTGYPVCVYAVVYEQYQDGGYDTEDRGALWLLHGGNSSRGCVKIATVKGVHCFESIYPFSGYYLDMENTNSWALAGAFLPATMHLHCNNVNPAYYGFSSMESNIIVSEAVEDFVDPEAETITED